MSTAAPADPARTHPPAPGATLLERCADWAAALRPEALPARVRALATSQIVSQLAAVRAGLSHPLGRRVAAAFGPPVQADPRRSAAALAALGCWLNLDDTAFAGHLGPSTVSTPVAWALDGHVDGAGLVAAVVAADECAARMTAAATLGPFRGQSAAHTHLAGAVAGRLHAEGADAARWAHAWALAFTMPPYPIMPGFLAADGRVLSTLAPVRAAMDACDAAAAGLGGALDVLEHPDGFLAHFAAVPLPDSVVDGLGERWYTDTLSFKMRPGGPGVDAAVDCALDLRPELGGLDVDDVAAVDVEGSAYTTWAGKLGDQRAAGGRTPLSSLLLTVPYAVATALLDGDLRAADFAEPALDDPRRWALAAKVTLTHDPDMTAALLASDAPFGEALRRAGGRARDWLAGLGSSTAALVDLDASPRESFAESVKATPARVTVTLADGRRLTRRREIPVGAAGPETRARHRELVRDKFVRTGGDPAVADGLADLENRSAAQTARLLRAALADRGRIRTVSVPGQMPTT